MSRLRTLGLTLALCSLTLGAVPPPPLGTSSGDPVAIQSVLDAMADAWNRDDLEAHAAPYAQDATYTLPDGLRHGRDGVLQSLQGFKQGDDLLGELRFEDVSIRMLGTANALVTGRFALAVPGRPDATGRFTLVFENRSGSWMILHDHSS